MANYESVLKLRRLSFSNIEYKRNIDLNLSDVKFGLDFHRNVVAIDDDNYRVELTASVFSDDDLKSIQIKATIVGFFVCEEQDQEMKKHLIYENSIAIMFPYLRSQITLISAQPDMHPIIIPPVNISAMLNKS